jgi:hypothetical protein
MQNKLVLMKERTTRETSVLINSFFNRHVLRKDVD